MVNKMEIITKIKKRITDFIEYRYFMHIEKEKQKELEKLVDEYLYSYQQ